MPRCYWPKFEVELPIGEQLRGVCCSARQHPCGCSKDVAARVRNGAHVTPCAGICAQVLPPAVANGLDGVVRGMAQDLNSCMRIFTTPMPFAYIVHLRLAGL